MAQSPQSLEKSLELLSEIVVDGDVRLRVLAERLNIPLSTAHRLVAGLENSGFLTREQRGRYRPGPAILMMLQTVDLHEMIRRIGAPLLKDLSQAVRRTVHLGVMESSMVTYLIKHPYGRKELFTREGMQLEAYCSGLGKVLLAHSDPEELDSYLADGPFIALTSKTVVEPELLREELIHVREQGYAVDDEEVTEGLRCVAVPVFGVGGRVRAAISASAPVMEAASADPAAILGSLRECAEALGAALLPRRPAH